MRKLVCTLTFKGGLHGAVNLMYAFVYYVVHLLVNLNGGRKTSQRTGEIQDH